jgi:MarR family transcriptional regulator, transcriptional regulator for hemolysin
MVAMATSTDTRVEADLGFLLAQASFAMATELTHALASIGITPRGFCVLSRALGEEKTQGALATEAALDKTTMVVTVDELEAAGLAERRPSTTDRRVRIIAVTPEGERKVAEGQAIVDEVHRSVLENLSPEERDGFVAGLERLASGRLATPVECQRPPRRRAPRLS